jgi:hypothetical protein
MTGIQSSNRKRIAWFVSPHGFGHAARACAVMDAIHELEPGTTFEIFTTVPEFFFRESLKRGPYNYHSVITDLGLAQRSALVSDIPETVRRLDRFLPFDDKLTTDLAAQLNRSGCSLAVCDIAPLGIVVARTAGIPSLLIENFTWDWIYEHYSADFPELNRHIDYLREVFAGADFHLQAQPVCNKTECHLTTPPIGRKPVLPPRQIRQQLKVPQHVKVLLISMGGVPEELPFVRKLSNHKEFYFIIPGSPSFSHDGNVVRLPHDSGIYHPDLINACDAVVGKPGYSTVAETYRVGIPIGSISRPNFRESAIMEDFIRQEMNGLLIPEPEFRDGSWLKDVSRLLTMPRIERIGPGGAETAAQFILQSFLESPGH